jgi:hypothetical protein
MTVTRTAGVFFALFVATGVASAQEVPPPQNPPPQNPPTPPVAVPATPAPSVTPVAAETAPLSMNELRRRREAIDAMEGMLPTKVRAAAKDTMREIEALQQQPVNFLTTSQPRARGFHLEGYGVFFYVEIPGVRSSVTSLFREELQRRADRTNSGGEGSASRTVERTSMPFDANASYTQAVKRQLIEAMLDYSQPLDLRPSEWLTIAARDGDEPIPNVIYESITMVVRARGSDLSDFRAQRITRDEMLKRVEVRGF